MNRILYIMILCLFIVTGCSNMEKISGLEGKLKPTYLILAENDSKVLFLDKNDKIIKQIENKGKFSQVILEDSGKYFYATSDGTYDGNQAYLYKYSISSGKMIEKIELSIIPSLLTIVGNKAYIASSEPYSDGFPFEVLDLGTKDEKNFLTKGMVSSIQKYNGKVYIGVNSGGATLFGEYSNIYEIREDGSRFVPKAILNEKIELPPSDMYFNGDKVYCLFTGFSYGPKPEWVKEPERYTNKLMVFDLSSGKMMADIKLSKPFPQKIMKNGNKFIINHYTDLDMKGVGITVLDTEKLVEEAFIDVKNPSYMDLNLENGDIITSNSSDGAITLIKQNGEQKQVFVGENCSIVKYVKKGK